MTHRTINAFTLFTAILTGAVLVCALEWWSSIEQAVMSAIEAL